MAAKIWLVRLLPAWATLALEILRNFSKRRLSSRLLSRPKENSFKPFKVWAWERADLLTFRRFTLYRFIAMTDRRVVITGLGVLTPVGNDIQTICSNLKTGVSAIHTIDALDPMSYDRS